MVRNNLNNFHGIFLIYYHLNTKFDYNYIIKIQINLIKNKNKNIKFYNKVIMFWNIINPLASPSAGAPALEYGDVNTETTSPGEVKGLIIFN